MNVKRDYIKILFSCPFVQGNEIQIILKNGTIRQFFNETHLVTMNSLVKRIQSLGYICVLCNEGCGLLIKTIDHSNIGRLFTVVSGGAEQGEPQFI